LFEKGASFFIVVKISAKSTQLFSIKGVLLLKRFDNYTRPLHNYDAHIATKEHSEILIFNQIN
jgi:hypothetical protein